MPSTNDYEIVMIEVGIVLSVFVLTLITIWFCRRRKIAHQKLKQI